MTPKCVWTDCNHRAVDRLLKTCEDLAMKASKEMDRRDNLCFMVKQFSYAVFHYVSRQILVRATAPKKRLWTNACDTQAGFSYNYVAAISAKSHRCL
jgi:hypothetical protein